MLTTKETQANDQAQDSVETCQPPAPEPSKTPKTPIVSPHDYGVLMLKCSPGKSICQVRFNQTFNKIPNVIVSIEENEHHQTELIANSTKVSRTSCNIEIETGPLATRRADDYVQINWFAFESIETPPKTPPTPINSNKIH